MNQNGKQNGSKSVAMDQRRTQSINESDLSLIKNDYYGRRHHHRLSQCREEDRSHSLDADDRSIDGLKQRKTSRQRLKTLIRTRSAFAPSPKCNFGPKGTLKKVQDNKHLIVIQDPSSQRLQWVSPATHFLIIRKPGPSTLKQFRILVLKLLQRGFRVYIESSDYSDLPLEKDADLKEHSQRCFAFNQESDSCEIDLVICIGGDGTLLHTSSIFQKSCPPVLSFSMGSLGFLTPFNFDDHDRILDDILSGNVSVLLRTRIDCTIIKETEDGSPSDSPPPIPHPEKAVSSKNNNRVSYLALNEVVIDRGTNSYLSNLDLYINDRFITKVQGDGLIVSTPTGSTAYAMAAGASMVHPNVPAMVICPICPHSLSFRPIVVPAGIELKVKVSEDARLTACLSVDGRNSYELDQQNSVRITTSVYPVPMICQFDQVGDWFESLADILHWNLRKPQSKLVPDNSERHHDESSGSSEDEKSDDNRSSSSHSTYDSVINVEY